MPSARVSAQVVAPETGRLFYGRVINPDITGRKTLSRMRAGYCSANIYFIYETGETQLTQKNQKYKLIHKQDTNMYHFM